MSKIMEMIHFNVNLSQWESYVSREQGGGFFSAKNPEKHARIIFSQLSHPKVVDLLAKEFDSLSHEIRIMIRTMCNDEPSSGNVRKGIQRLDKLMNGKLLRQIDDKQYTRVSTRDGFRQKEVRPEVAGATRKYQIIQERIQQERDRQEKNSKIGMGKKK